MLFRNVMFIPWNKHVYSGINMFIPGINMFIPWNKHVYSENVMFIPEMSNPQHEQAWSIEPPEMTEIF